MKKYVIPYEIKFYLRDSFTGAFQIHYNKRFSVDRLFLTYLRALEVTCIRNLEKFLKLFRLKMY